LPYRAKDALKTQAAKLVGAERSGLKLLAIAAVLLIAYLSLAKTDYKLSANMALEGAVQRALVAPFDGYIGEAPSRPGDLVAENDVLCRLDDRDLELERLKWSSQRSELRRRLQEALAGYDRVEVSIANAQLEQVQAQLDLTESRLARTAIRAPFDGVVVNGDLSQRLGGAVQKGELLFQVTPLDAYRVILKIPEGRISDVREGQQGSLVLAALPHQAFDFTVRRITPISLAEEGQNHYRVEADLAQTVDALRPGMEGVAKIQVDRRRILGIWTRNIREWVRLKVWAWWG
jgi:multidrug resistance efflux pump